MSHARTSPLFFRLFGTNEHAGDLMEQRTHDLIGN
jgi:hypothetical protein